MNVFLLYPDREWLNPDYYIDYKNITTDLTLNSMFSLASQKVIYQNNTVKRIESPDPYIKDTMYRVVLTPLKSSEEIYYRQSIIEDAIRNEEFIEAVYTLTGKTLMNWDKLGRHVINKGSTDQTGKLVTRIHTIKLFSDSLSVLKSFIIAKRGNFKSQGLQSFCKRFLESYSDEKENLIKDILSRISFYVSTDDTVYKKPTVEKPCFAMSCKVGDGCKLIDFKLTDLETSLQKYRNPDSTISKLKEYITSLSQDSFSTDNSIETSKQAAMLETAVIKYVLSFFEPFMDEFEPFWDRLHFQIAFYRGAAILTHHVKRFGLNYCYPKVCDRKRLSFAELKEFVMCIEQKVDAVGNTCEIDPKMLIIITGANQGGKSTFLRSIGIAQVMLQCGLFVIADRFESGLFSSLFMHFTRREDETMNSGRLDEELNRMNGIVNNLGPDSLILLNESFATTTEKDGSVIAYDIIKALNEAGVKIITVTHLLSFAQKMYEENKALEASGKPSDVTFFCAERKENGERTYKMIQNIPSLTSFGLDLYEQIIEGESE